MTYGEFLHKACFWLLVLLIALLPLSGNGSPFKSIYPFLFLFCCFIGFCKCASLCRKGEEFAPIACVSVVLFLSISLSSLVNVVSYDFYRAKDLFSFVMAIFLPFFVLHSVVTERQKSLLYSVIIFLVLLNFFVGIVQLTNGVDPIFGNPLVGGRITGIFSWGAPVVGSFCGLVFPVLYSKFMKGNGLNLTHLFFIFLFYVIMIVGGNRSMLLSAMSAHVLVVIVSGNRSGVILKQNLLLLGLVLLVGSSLFVYFSEIFSDNLTSRLLSLGGNILEEQQTKRIATWQQTLCLIEHNFLVGVGYGNFEINHVNYLHCAINSEGAMPHPHHIYLDIFSTLGLLGFIVFMGFVSLLFFRYVLRMSVDILRIESFVILFIIFSPLNVTHGLISLWWSIMCFVLTGMILVNHRLDRTFNLA